MIQEYVRALLLIFMAEIGDKTQILAMAFATQYNIGQVLIGVLVGSLFNHGIAVILGSLLSSIIPLQLIQIVAGFSFVGFALWTLKFEEEKDEEDKTKKVGPILTVAIAFFIGELGDKTQLTAITLAADAHFPLFILLGTVSGMVIISGMGIFVGSKLGKRVPEFTIKLVSASIFLFFGLSKLYNTLPKTYINSTTITIGSILLLISIFLLLRPHMIAGKNNRISTLKQVASTLQEHTMEMKEKIEDICLGDDFCGECKGKDCIINHTKTLINSIVEEDYSVDLMNRKRYTISLQKPFSRKKVVESLIITLDCLLRTSSQEVKLQQSIHEVRKDLEFILFGKELPFVFGIEQYLDHMMKVDPQISKEIKERIGY